MALLTFNLPGKNTLAYFEPPPVTTKKKLFITFESRKRHRLENDYFQMVLKKGLFFTNFLRSFLMMGGARWGGGW
jgi:hypothetical protein